MQFRFSIWLNVFLVAAAITFIVFDMKIVNDSMVAMNDHCPGRVQQDRNGDAFCKTEPIQK
jgi:hypothetical protein